MKNDSRAWPIRTPRCAAASRKCGWRSIAPRAADLGVSVMDIEQALNTLVAGQVASTFNAGDDQYDVRVRAQEQFRTSAEGLAAMTVPSTKSGLGGARRSGATSSPAPALRRSTASTGSGR